VVRFYNRLCETMEAFMRTYLPTILKLLNFLCAYIARHRDTIVRFIGPSNVPALDALVDACHVFTDVILPIINPPV
jgi:hypothetical protein